MTEPLLAGWGEADITPESHVVELDGQYYQRIAHGVHSRLKTVALALSRGADATIFVSVDTVSLKADVCERLRTVIAERLQDLPSDRVIFTATHTHTGMRLSSGRNWWTPHPEALSVEDYRTQVETAVAQAVEQAWNRRAACGVAPALGTARLGHCRRAVYANGTAEMYGRTDRPDFIGMEGGEDSGVELLYFYNKKRQPTGVIVNAACPAQVMEATGLISSDYMGALREKLKQHFGDAFHTLCLIGAAGCQSPRDLTRPRERDGTFWSPRGVDILSDHLMETVASAAAGADERMEWNAPLGHATSRLALPRRRASYPEMLRARATLNELEAAHSVETAYNAFCEDVRRNEAAGATPPYDSKLHPFVAMRNEEAVLKRYADQDDTPHYEMRLDVVRIGASVLATNPFELFLEYGQRIRSRSPAAHTLTAQLANDSAGYLPSPRAEVLGGYGGRIINGHVGADGGALLVDATLKEIQQLL